MNMLAGDLMHVPHGQKNHDIELKISPGQVHTRTSSVVERRHQLLRRAVQIYMDDNEISGVDAVHEALTWVIPSLNEHTFLNGFTPTQLAMGRQPTIPGLTSEERTKPPQLSEGQTSPGDPSVSISSSTSMCQSRC